MEVTVLAVMISPLIILLIEAIIDIFKDINKPLLNEYKATLKFGTVKLDFDKFLTFYYGDPENWKFKSKLQHYDSYNYAPHSFDNPVPCYGDEVVCFKNIREYKKFLKWRESSIKKGNDYKNTQAQIKLAQDISTNAQKRIEDISNAMIKNVEAIHLTFSRDEDKE